VGILSPARRGIDAPATRGLPSSAGIMADKASIAFPIGSGRRASPEPPCLCGAGFGGHGNLWMPRGKPSRSRVPPTAGLLPVISVAVEILSMKAGDWAQD
jgi:hypothetical protein